VSSPSLTALQIADPPEHWAALGFAIDGERFCVGGVELVFGGDQGGVVTWAVSGLQAPLDGLPTSTWLEKWLVANQKPTQVEHPNGAMAIDHLVVVTPDFDRTSSALDAAGLPLRRVREAPGGFRQGFRRLGPAILEIVEARQAPAGPARFWGLTFVVADLDALAHRLGPRLTPIRAAVQPGRRIAPLARSAGLSTRLAFMDPE
jgi:hypothetical protein